MRKQKKVILCPRQWLEITKVEYYRKQYTYIHICLIRIYRVSKLFCFRCFQSQFQRGDTILENKVEKYFRDEVKKIGGKAFKFSSPGNNGVPDRIVVYKGKCYFVELKRPGEELRPLQRVVCRKFNRLGFKVYVIDSIDKVGEFINEVHTP